MLYIFLFAYCLALLQNYNLHEKRVFFSFVLAQLPACRRMSGTFQNYLLNKSTNGTLNEAELNFIVVVFTDLLRAFARLAHGVHSPFNKRKEHFHLNLSDLLPQMLPKKHTQDQSWGTLFRDQTHLERKYFFLMLPKGEGSLEKQRGLFLLSNAISTPQKQDEHNGCSAGFQESKLISMSLGLILGRQISLMFLLGRVLLFIRLTWSAERCLPWSSSLHQQRWNLIITVPQATLQMELHCWKYSR